MRAVTLPCFLPQALPVPPKHRRNSRRLDDRSSLGSRRCSVCQPTVCMLPAVAAATAEATPLTPITFRGRRCYIKRDDILESGGVRGSKVRKFESLLSTNALSDVDVVISYGGAQSNAMLALARLCRNQNKPFVYVTRPTPAALADAAGNFRDSLKAGMIHMKIGNDLFRRIVTDNMPREVESDLREEIFRNGLTSESDKVLFIPQGGAWDGAELGVANLAEELRQQIQSLRANKCLALKKPIIFLASGTGTTAFYLSKHVVDFAKVVAVPVSGDEKYLVKQMRWLDDYRRDSSSKGINAPVLPDVLRPRLRGSFADVRPEKLLIWEELRRATKGEFEFDLVYAPKAWEEVMLAITEGRVGSDGEDLIYYHSGGVEGNISMIERFRKKGLL